MLDVVPIEPLDRRGGQGPVVRGDCDVVRARNGIGDVEEALSLVTSPVVGVWPLPLHDAHAESELDRLPRIGEAPAPARRQRAPERRARKLPKELPARLGVLEPRRVEMDC